jgi:hypothetical protein
MNPHADAHELLLAAVLAGERSADEPEVRRHFAACAECRERHARLARTVAAVTRAGAERSAVLAELRDDTGLAEHRTHTTLERLFLEGSSTRRRVNRRWLWASAAAALLVAGGWLVARRGTPPAPPQYLGHQGLELLLPTEGSGYGEFSWKYEGSAPDRYRLRIFDARDEARSSALVDEELFELRWTPPVETLATLPERILYRVDVLDVMRDVLASSSRSASR